MFIDQAKIFVKGGAGGRGCQSFYRDKYSRKGVPNGGDGGKGGDVIIRADRNLFTLLDFKYNRHFYAKSGAHGLGKNKTGANAQDLIIRVPPGTLIKDAQSGMVLRDLSLDQEELVIVRGGKGGLGNRYHRDATDAEVPQEQEIILDLKLIAEVGVVGFPNAGKSTLVSAISSAHPKIAAYPFTTKAPVLGLVRHKEKSFVAADVPGLIEGSSKGRGLGDKFLRHLERTKILVHLLDMSGFEGRDPLKDFQVINQELISYGKVLAGKPQIIAANKMDLAGVKLNLARFKKAIKKKIYPISALEKIGLEELVEAISKELSAYRS
ncbi:MAG: GTPase ObgE [Candidatus Omnitrophota bacterium]